MAFIFQFVNVAYYIDWFADTEESLHPWDKAHLVMVYDLCNVLLDSEYIMQNAWLNESQAGIKTAGRNINNSDIQMIPL